ncbi:MAG: two-component regulator propeller domain-containing protein, partial [bacterium]
MHTQLRFVFQIVVWLLLFSHAQSQREYKLFDDEWRWIRFSQESGLPSNHIYNLTETKDGIVWVATTAGVAFYDG